MISIEEAVELIDSHVSPLGCVEVPLDDAVGKVLGKDVAADVDQPPFSKSLVDGFAVQLPDTIGAGTTRLKITERVAAGESALLEVNRNSAIQVMTGAPIPKGATSVIMIEDVVLGEDSIEFDPTLHRSGQMILPQGAVAKNSAIVVEQGKLISPATVGLLAECGCSHPIVRPNPQIATLTTGDEVIPVDQTPDHRTIRNSNGPILKALVASVGSHAEDLGHAPDSLTALEKRIERGLANDVLVVTGGVSMGDKDFVPEAFTRLGVKKVFHKVNLKPGKPCWFGVYERNHHRCHVFGLPGNPVSVFVCFELFVKAAIRKLCGYPNLNGRIEQAELKQDFTNRGNRFLLQPGRLSDDARMVAVLPWIGSADLVRLSHANCLLRFAAGESYQAGEQIELIRLTYDL